MSLFMKKNNDSQSRRTKLFNEVCTVVYNNHKNNSTFDSPIYTFFLAENIIIFTPNQGTNGEKYFTHINYEGKYADSGRKKTPFYPSFPSEAASFQSFDGKCTGLICQKWTSICLFPRRHNKY